MIRLATALLVVLFGASAAFAFDTPVALITALYAPYLKGDAYDWSDYDVTVLQSAPLNALFAKDTEEADGEVGRIDFDPYIDGQDYIITNLKIGEAKVDGDAATVEVTFENFDIAKDMIFSLVQEKDGWKVDNVESKGGEYPYSLVALLEAPLN